MSIVRKENSDVDVSVIVPMYNVENLIIETIECLKKNKCSLEVILINDGSTDDTLNSALNAVDGDSRFIILNQENTGVAIARNNALEIATGEYITFVDSDDIIADYGLDKLFYTAKDKKSDFIYGAVKKFTRTREWYLDAHIRHGLFVPGYKNISDNPEVLFFIGVAGKLIHRSLLKDLYFPEGIKFSEDTAVMVQTFVRAHNIYTISDVIYYYRERDIEIDGASATQKKNSQGYNYLIDLFQTISICKEAIYNDNKLSDQEKLTFLKKYYDRIFAYEAWPLFISALKDKNSNKNVLQAMLDFLQSHSIDELNQLPAIRLYLIKVFIDHIYLVRTESYSAYRQLIKYLFSSLNKNIHKICSSPKGYGRKWHDSYKLAYSSNYKGYLAFFKIKFVKYWNYTLKNDRSYINFFFNTIRWIAPKDKNKIVFSTHKPKPFSTNFDALHQALMDQPDAEQYTVYKFLGETTRLRTIYKRYYHLATAKVVFLEDYHKPVYGLKFSKKTSVVQIWHACGAFKKFAHDAIGAGDSNSSDLEEKAHKMYTNIMVSAQSIIPLYASAFSTIESKVQSLGVPRTDIFFDNKEKAKIVNKISQKYPFLLNTYNVLYAPTFRGGGSSRSTFELNIDWALLKSLPDHYRFIIKLHPVVKTITPEIPDAIKHRIVVLPATEDVNQWMFFCDLLITDYSSLIFEYSLLNKPIIFYPHDLHNYYDERGFYFPYEHYTYGEVVHDTKALVDAIITAEIKMKIFKNKKIKFKELFMEACDGSSAKRIIHQLLDNK